MGLSTGIPGESSNCALMGSQRLRGSLPGWPHLGSRCWPSAGSCRSQIAGSSRQNCREIIRCCLTFGGWWHPALRLLKIGVIGEGEWRATTFPHLFMPDPAWASVRVLVCAHLQGGAIYSSCTPSPVRLLLSRLPWPSEAIWRHWVGGEKGNQILHWGKSQRRRSQTEETPREIMFL